MVIVLLSLLNCYGLLVFLLFRVRSSILHLNFTELRHIEWTKNTKHAEGKRLFFI